MEFAQFRIFANDNLGSVRTTYNQTDGSVWFVLSDVCKILGLSNPSTVAASLDDDEIAVIHNTTGNRAHSINLVNESGMYSIIFRSRKEEAKVFRKWVTSVVLPSIRINGSYSLGQEDTSGSECERLLQQVKALEKENAELKEENADLLSEYRSLFEKTVPSAPEDVVVTKEGYVFSKELWETLNDED